MYHLDFQVVREDLYMVFSVIDTHLSLNRYSAVVIFSRNCTKIPVYALNTSNGTTDLRRAHEMFLR